MGSIMNTNQNSGGNAARDWVFRKSIPAPLASLKILLLHLH